MHPVRPLLVALCMLAAVAAHSAPQILNRTPLHLRSGTKPEWDEFAEHTPDGTGFQVRFAGETNAEESCLLITQDNVKLDWPVELNGRKIGTLFLMEAPLTHALAVPAGTLHEGENVLSIKPPKENDDITIGEIALDRRSRKATLSSAELQVEVVDSDSGLALPSRVTIVDSSGRLAALWAQPGGKLAVRPGVVYSADGRATVGLLPGEFTVYATRGFEYGLGTEHVSVVSGQHAQVRLRIRREVSTAGWICTDTHIHTGTYAHHGDASIDERAITLAGEGIEMPISTEHDCLVDFAGAARRTGVQEWFTPVIGEEVTTAQGHFNIFPVNFLAALPDKKVTDWPQLMKSFRATPGVQVVTLNHPRNIHSDFQPFAATNFNAVTGENLRGFEFTFDAIEVANSSALQSDWMVSVRDWFALLNYGYRFTAVGSSDVHDVSRYIVGQGRTYIACDDSNLARIDVLDACRNLCQGRALVSLGLLANLTLEERFKVGDVATGLPEQMRVDVNVQGPSWVRADRVELFSNGIRIRDQQIDPDAQTPSNSARPGPLKANLSWSIPRPKHDVYLVALASGPGIREPFWALARPYQPSSPTWDPRVLGLTNPVWIDGDGDGQFTAARAYARQLVQKHGQDAAALQTALNGYDAAVAAQAASLTQHP